MLKNSIYIVLFIASLSVHSLMAQEATGIKDPEIKVLSRAQQDRILLRWAADTPTAWKLLNTHGYELQRLTVTRNNQTLPVPEVKVIGIMKPEPLEAWESDIQNNDNAAIMAQAIYGESFAITGGNKLEAIVNISEESQQRFTFSLFAADQDFNVAVKAGLGYIDSDVRPNEKYLYKITSRVPETIKVINDGGVFIGLSDYQPLPEPLDFTGIFSDSSVMLSWNYKVLSTLYGSYNVERSTDGGDFKRINKTPYTILNPTILDQENGRIFYVDSVTNNVNYTYRIKGISPFGEEGPASKTASGEGKEVLKFVPHLRKKDISNSNKVTLTWEFPEEGNDQITKFELNRALKESGPYEVVLDNIPPLERSVEYTGLEPSNYFTITAVGKQKNKRTSFAMLVQPIDSIPPKVPIGLKATIDTLGVVKLSWTKNTETDLLGYRVFMANKANAEFSPLASSPQKRNLYTDSLNMKTLNSKIFYRVSAMDLRYNMSELSEIIEVRKPDVIPPTSPVFKSYKLTDDGTIMLNWAKSSSDDVKNYLLYRKQNDAAEWELISEGNKEQTTFTDKKIEEGNLYSYTILAKDDSGLESTPSPAVSIGVKRLGLRPKVKGFYATANRERERMEISWRYKEDNVAEFEIYRAEQDGPLRLFRMTPAGTKVVYDENMTINTNYTYKIRAIFKDGNVSEVNKIEVKY